MLFELKVANYSEPGPGPGSPDCDGEKTLRRAPRKTERGAAVVAASQQTEGNGPSSSHAAYIRSLTERLSYDF